MNARTTISGNEPGLLAYWPLGAEIEGALVPDRSAAGQASGQASGVDVVACTASIGNPGGLVLSLPPNSNGCVDCSSFTLPSVGFTIECWARRSSVKSVVDELIASVDSSGTGLSFGFRSDGSLTLSLGNVRLDSSTKFTDGDWHHWCGTYNASKKTFELYRDGELVATKAGAGTFTPKGTLVIGASSKKVSSPPATTSITYGAFFGGEIAELRIWSGALVAADIRSTMRRRITGSEENLLAYYPFDEAPESGKAAVKDKSPSLAIGELKGSAKVLLCTSLPISGVRSVITAEYSCVELGAGGATQALMRRFYGFAAGGKVNLLPEQRVEELALQWVGNTQIKPTLLGYIEGAPPVPSENLTESDDGYDEASTITLTQSSEISYSWQRSLNNRAAFNMEGLIGGAWSVQAGFMLLETVSEGHVGAAYNYTHEDSETRDTAITASSGLTSSDSLTLVGDFDDGSLNPALGKLWLPKNVGYALVLSGMADIFVTKLKRSGRVVSYDVRPVEGVPLDVNTITFMINPAYTMNGSLDGMIGEAPADPTFYPHVPAMRAQYGARYPASYLRLTEAYDLKRQIEKQDQERASFFENFDVDRLDNVDEIDSFGVPETVSVSGGTKKSSTNTTQEEADAVISESDEEKDELQSEAEERQKAINEKLDGLAAKTRANAAFSDWQRRMEGLKAAAGKRNIVNTYVWDADGGLHAEEQSFASTIEHSITSETNDEGGAGLDTENEIAGFMFNISLIGSGGRSDANSKTLSTSSALELTVDVSGVERKGIMDRRDRPIKPGQKVDRYRFMSFYLEGHTDHFHDFWSHVVDPEWLMSNGEEARALRQARGAKPNACWRVFHRVTYVERPVLGAKDK